MANIYEGAVEVSRRTMTLFFMVDASGSMDGAKMGTLNSAIEEVIPEIRKISAENADAAQDYTPLFTAEKDAVAEEAEPQEQAADDGKE